VNLLVPLSVFYVTTGVTFAVTHTFHVLGSGHRSSTGGFGLLLDAVVRAVLWPVFLREALR
jgi:hypothetical protein